MYYQISGTNFVCERKKNRTKKNKAAVLTQVSYQESNTLNQRVKILEATTLKDGLSDYQFYFASFLVQVRGEE